MNLNIAICDDDKNDISSEKNMIGSILSKKGIGYDIKTFLSPKDMLNVEIIYDIVFLDIRMDEMDGIELARQILQRKKNCYIFFLTSYSVYLDEAFDVNAIRYLTKPIDIKRLESGIDKVIERINDATKMVCVVNFSNKLSIEIPVSSIIYIENTGRRTHIVSTKYDFVAKELFSALKSQIEKEVNYFAMPHQSFFVNLKYVTGHSRQGVHMSYAGKVYITDMSRRRFNDFNKKIFLMANTL